MTTRTWALRAAALCATVPLIGAPGMANGDTSQQATAYTLVAKHSGKCLTAAGTGDGAAVMQMTCAGHSTQKWILDIGGTTTKIRSVGATNHCLDLWGNINGDTVGIVSWTCYNAPQQNWRLNWRGGRYYEIRAHDTDRCIDVPHTSRAEGVPVYQWGCHIADNANQQWELRYEG
ncbi:Ricin-type beta-trefoil lectin domain-like [Lentzea albidocapillata subsp. violacea]|uniref:Ricin-type beta-trefoil lectin domain-like n=1 Tax=Lentzea albidocapillata subsp. violacea TaxID=128104 RepID=A0A1G8QGB7_9PSEU|nr:RICIN domain-containing protein [Lentzea albidocapillata]SDJ03839.1 Ricin-type beta-trefoil lectin domain-like [Lentzea albidocapillata subsp. violacea]